MEFKKMYLIWDILYKDTYIVVCVYARARVYVI